MTYSEAFRDRWRHLVDGYMQGTCTRGELDEFLETLRDNPAGQGLAEEFQRYWSAAEALSAPTDAEWERRYDEMMDKANRLLGEDSGPRRERRRRRYVRLVAAAVILGLLWGGWWWYRNPYVGVSVSPDPPSTAATIQPGGNKAILVLAGGTPVVLDSLHTQDLPRQGASRVQRLGNGQIRYTVVGSSSATPVFNTLKVPKAGQYRIVLPDGTGVWLNAASTLTYPTAFTGRVRQVQLTGEAYFEIASDPDHPFVVRAGGITAKVLGTRFNVMAYPDEPTTNTTLLEGSLKVSTTSEGMLLHPGQQARTKPFSGDIRVQRCDTAEAVGWKDGLFRFHDTDLKTIMRQVARWYDVRVTYQGDISDRDFTGTLSRNVSLDHVLQVLALSKVHFKVTGSVITVFQ